MPIIISWLEIERNKDLFLVWHLNNDNDDKMTILSDNLRHSPFAKRAEIRLICMRRRWNVWVSKNEKGLALALQVVLIWHVYISFMFGINYLLEICSIVWNFLSSSVLVLKCFCVGKTFKIRGKSVIFKEVFFSVTMGVSDIWRSLKQFCNKRWDWVQDSGVLEGIIIQIDKSILG